jgi:hypothetical protein
VETYQILSTWNFKICLQYWILHWYISPSVIDKYCWLRVLGVQICKIITSVEKAVMHMWRHRRVVCSDDYSTTHIKYSLKSDGLQVLWAECRIQFRCLLLRFCCGVEPGCCGVAGDDVPLDARLTGDLFTPQQPGSTPQQNLSSRHRNWTRHSTHSTRRLYYLLTLTNIIYVWYCSRHYIQPYSTST